MRYIASVVVVGGVFFIYFGVRWVFIAARGLSRVAAERGSSLAVVLGLVIAVASLVSELRLWGAWASVVVAHELSCPEACGTLQDQGWNPSGPGSEPMAPTLVGGPPGRSGHVAIIVTPIPLVPGSGASWCKSTPSQPDALPSVDHARFLPCFQ